MRYSIHNISINNSLFGSLEVYELHVSQGWKSEEDTSQQVKIQAKGFATSIDSQLYGSTREALLTVDSQSKQLNAALMLVNQTRFCTIERAELALRQDDMDLAEILILQAEAAKTIAGTLAEWSYVAEDREKTRLKGLKERLSALNDPF